MTFIGHNPVKRTSTSPVTKEPPVIQQPTLTSTNMTQLSTQTTDNDILIVPTDQDVTTAPPVPDIKFDWFSSGSNIALT